MKKYALNEITPMQFTFMIHGAQVGLGILTLPRELAQTAGTDGWISLLLGWALAIVCSVILIQVMKKHPEDTIYDLLPRYFGKWIGKVLHVVFVLYFAFGFLTSVYTSASIIILEILPKTPYFMIVFLFCLPIYTIARNHVRVLGRYAELVFWGFLWMILVFFLTLKDGEWLHLLPVVKEGWSPILLGVKNTAFSFLGFETAFVLYPFLKNKKMAVRGIVIANTITMLEYLLAVFTCFLFFSPDGIADFVYPSLKLVKIIEFRFLERFEIIFLVSYLFVLSRLWVSYVYYATFGSSQLFGKQDHRPHLRVLLLGVLLLSCFFSPSYDHLELLKNGFAWSGVVIGFAFPLFLLAYTWMYGLWRKGNAA